MRLGIAGLILCALVFSVSYGFIEYYVIRDTTFGYNPLLLSLVYPYHFAMAAIFGFVSWGLLRMNASNNGIFAGILLAGTLFFGMLAIEDFTWFALRAAAPVQGDLNAGSLVLAGEWTTQFVGSVDAHFTVIPNWYFLSPGLVATLATTRRRRWLAAVASA
jgi:hypothetical protein